MSWDRDELLRAARTKVANDPEMRLGQALYNAAYRMNPAVAKLAGTDCDPFYDDERIEAFLDKLGAPRATTEE